MLSGIFSTERAAWVLSVAVPILLCPHALWAQPGCTGPPQPPERFSAKVDEAVMARGTVPFVPALLTLKWRAPALDQTQQGNRSLAYLIEAGSSPGGKDVVTIQAGGLDQEYVTPVADGTYYIRLRSANGCGESQATREVKVQIRNSVAPGRPNPFVILSTVHATRERLGGSAFVRVMGQVRNGWNAGPATLVTVTASYEDDGARLGVVQRSYVNGTNRRLKQSGLITDTVLEPAATGCFLMFAEFKTTKVTGLGLVAAASQIDSERVAGDVAVDGALAVRSDEFDTLRASGRVRNVGAIPTVMNEVWVEARDEKGRVLDCTAEAVRARLLASEARDIVVTTEAPFSMTRMFRWWVSWDEGELPATPRFDRYRELRGKLTALLETDRASTSPQDLAAARDALRGEVERIERGEAAPAPPVR